MNVAALRSKVTFQKNETVTDKYGNHKNVWTDYYTCFATIGGEGLASSKEEQVYLLRDDRRRGSGKFQGRAGRRDYGGRRFYDRYGQVLSEISGYYFHGIQGGVHG